MSDVDMAASLLDDVIGARGVREPVKSMLERAYALLSRRNSAWTRRRVRAVFNKEASRIEHREIEDMRAILDARKKHAAYREETARLAQVAVIRAQERVGNVAP
ncbi:hypothetical protein C7374_105177 [Falsochrobactrum ovis]|uniref:Uncharacterized protein n=2 Tax=Falsochrobactrum ovis TaxID=1293442 RepID=A0A364JVI6_9HYPH|nr:hypothetical protein C7374_105177 [Falsochrobactrum ovis]